MTAPLISSIEVQATADFVIITANAVDDKFRSCAHTYALSVAGLTPEQKAEKINSNVLAMCDYVLRALSMGEIGEDSEALKAIRASCVALLKQIEQFPGTGHVLAAYGKLVNDNAPWLALEPLTEWHKLFKGIKVCADEGVSLPDLPMPPITSGLHKIREYTAAMRGALINARAARKAAKQ